MVGLARKRSATQFNLMTTGAALVTLGMLGIGGTALLSALVPPTLFPGVDLPAPIVRASGAVLLLAVTARLVGMSPAAAQIPISLFWGASVVTATAAALVVWPEPTAWVGVVEAGFLLSVTAARAPEPRGRVESLAPIFATALLMLLGCVHLSNAAAVASLIPTWLPERPLLPLLSGATLVFASVAGCFPRVRTVAYNFVAAMILSWLPLIHLPRLLLEPDNVAEWYFAFGAFCVGGALLITSSVHKRRES